MPQLQFTRRWWASITVVAVLFATCTPAFADGETEPSSPVAPAAVAGDGEIVVSWSTPTSDGGSAITGYTAVAVDSSLNSSDCTTTSLTCTIPLLTNGTEYSVTVFATNAIGDSSPTSPLLRTPNVVPGAPTLDSAIAGNQTIALTWTAGTNDGTAVTGFTATAVDSGLNTHTCTAGATATSCSISSLTNGVQYSVTVTATNAAGTSAASNAIDATPMTVPSYPTLVSLTPGDQTIDVTWSASSSAGGGTIDGYRATATDAMSNSFDCTTDETATTCQITGLTNGTQYTVTVAAHNEVGYSTESGSGATTPRTTPDQVDAPTVTSLNASLKVEWSAPASDGGAAISGYTATATDGVTTKTCTWTSGPLECTISTLTNGTAYDVTVVATNAAGSSTPSDPTEGTPATVPSAPSITSVDRVLGTITVTWSAPSSTGGADVTDYTVTAVPNDASGDVVCTWTTGDGALTCDLADVVDTADYSITVVATNSAGDSSASSAASSDGYALPGAPTLTSVTIGNGTLTLVFTAGTNGGLTITDYAYSTDGGTTFDTFASVSGPYVITGLTNGHTYSVVLAAVNDLGQGASSNAISAKPATISSAPRWLHGVRGNGTATLLWNPPASNGGAAIVSYLVSDLAGHTCTATAPATTCTVTGLTNGTSYTFYVTATNAAGTSAASNANAVIPSTTPGAPTITSITPGNRKLSVQFSAPASNGGAALGYYDVSTDNGVTWKSTYGMVSGTTITVGGLTNGTTYQVKVRARNVVGPGAASAAASSTPRTIPSAPSITSLVGVSHGFTVNFAAPTSTGGASITTYQYSLNNGSTWITRPSGTTSLSFTVTGLVAKRKYNVMVRAVNVAGQSAPSVWRSVVTQ